MSDLHNKYASFKVPDEIEMLQKQGVNPIGSKNFTKMVLFAQENGIDNQIIDEYMALPQSRQEEEEYTNYKNRMKFQKALLKYRPFIYNHAG